MWTSGNRPISGLLFFLLRQYAYRYRLRFNVAGRGEKKRNLIWLSLDMRYNKLAPPYNTYHECFSSFIRIHARGAKLCVCLRLPYFLYPEQTH